MMKQQRKDPSNFIWCLEEHYDDGKWRVFIGTVGQTRKAAWDRWPYASRKHVRATKYVAVPRG